MVVVVLPEDREEAAVETAAAVADEVVELEGPAEPQPDSKASVTAANNDLIAPNSAERRMLHLPLLDVRAGPRIELTH